jgi:hypothetical protein
MDALDALDLGPLPPDAMVEQLMHEGGGRAPAHGGGRGALAASGAASASAPMPQIVGGSVIGGHCAAQ